MTFVHATSVAFRHKGSWRAILLRGPSGAGKSDLALRALEAGGRLISDDQTHLAARRGTLIASPPPPLKGLVEARGVGIVRLARTQLLTRAPVVLAVDLVPAARVERLPEAARETILGVSLPVLTVAAFEASAVMKLRLALAHIAPA